MAAKAVIQSKMHKNPEYAQITLLDFIKLAGV